jgi:hypothetical protein
MKDIEETEKIPVEQKEALHREYLYPREHFDKALTCEEPIIYSQSKILEILETQISDDMDSISEYVEEEIRPLFNLVE